MISPQFIRGRAIAMGARSQSKQSSNSIVETKYTFESHRQTRITQMTFPVAD
jgi:hypothetical protein